MPNQHTTPVTHGWQQDEADLTESQAGRLVRGTQFPTCDRLDEAPGPLSATSLVPLPNHLGALAGQPFQLCPSAGAEK